MAQCKPIPVIFDHDGGIDDLLSLLLLVRLPNINLIGVTITPADCYPDDALKSTRKLLALTGNCHVPVSVGSLCGPNPFPPEWRAQPKMCHAIPQMLRTDGQHIQVSSLDAHDFFINTLTANSSKVTVLMTGPATNLAHALTQKPTLSEKIEQVIWMGGAIDVKGNVAMHDHNGTAEWNAYWDPKATQQLLNSNANVCRVPLDATNDVPVNMDFLKSLANKNTPVSDLAGQFWAATTTAIPAYEFTYFLWDILSTCVLSLPTEKITKTKAMLATSVSTPNAGQTYRNDTLGSEVSWVNSVDADYVRAMVTHYLSGEFLEKPHDFESF